MTNTPNICFSCQTGCTVRKTTTHPQRKLSAKNKNYKYSDTYIRQTIIPTLQEMLNDSKKHHDMVCDAHRCKTTIRQKFRVTHARIMLKILGTLQKITRFFVLSIAEFFIVLFKILLSLIPAAIAFIAVTLLVLKFTGFDLVATSWFPYAKNIYIALAGLVAIVERLEFWGIIGGESWSHKHYRKKQEKMKKKNEEKRRKLVYKESKKLRKESIAKIPGFSAKYWNRYDLNSMIHAFTEGKANTWRAAYKYAKKQH